MSSPFTKLKLAGLATTLIGAPLFAGEPAAPADIGAVPVQIKDSGLPVDWQQRGVFMEILVRSYQDGNGDGIGDFKGLTQRLDYLQALGITGVWLLPIYQSSDHDHGYAVTNYRDIEHDYGTLADFDHFVAEAHKRGIGVILDYVINHSSDIHPLFTAANSDPASPWRNWYVWSDKKAQRLGDLWRGPWYAGKSGYYYGAFASIMPDFNFRNPQVLEFHLDNLRFWMNRGVDGFRFDAVGALVENGPNLWENQPENHAIMRKIRDLLNQYGKRYMVAEVPSAPAEFSASDSAGSAFAFGLQTSIIKSVQMGRSMGPLYDYLKQKNPCRAWPRFLSNHDSFAGARIGQQLGDDPGAYKLAAATLLTLPGIPFLYYGEEIGQTFSEPVQYDDQRLRGPMAWDGSAFAGFSKVKPFRALGNDYQRRNVAAEAGQPGSLLETYRSLIALRRNQVALQTGSLRVLSEEDDAVMAYVREKDGKQVLVLLNYSRKPAEFALKGDLAGKQWAPLFSSSALSQAVTGDTVKLVPQQALVLQRVQ